LIAEFGIDGIPIVDCRSRFLAPARWGDELIIETGVVGLHRCAFDIVHRVVNGAVLAVEATETRVCTALDPQQGRVRARELPDKLVETLFGRRPR
jgi:4-hydroxybenzoyl-CoA thioesterase